MQTRVHAPAEATKQQHHGAQQPAQLLVEQQSSFEDHSPQTAQLTSLRAMMSNSPPQQRTQVIQAKMNASAQTQQMRTLQARMESGDAVQREELDVPLQAKVNMQMKMDVSVNDDVGLETEADVMGEKAMQRGAVQNVKDDSDKTSSQVKQLSSFGGMLNAYQRKPSSVIQCSAEHYQYVPGEDNCCNDNFYQHLSEAEEYPGSISENRGAANHTIINMSLFELQNEIALFLNDLPEGTVLAGNVWINTQASYDYIHYYDGDVVDNGNDRINFRAQQNGDGQYEAYHFGKVGAF